MSDTPPPELVEQFKTRHLHPDSPGVRDTLAALAEWATDADGTVGLIDPATWTVVDAEGKKGKWCRTHNKQAHGFGVAAVCPNDPSCDVRPLVVLLPRGGEL